jgi:hypothetical protein
VAPIDNSVKVIYGFVAKGWPNHPQKSVGGGARLSWGGRPNSSERMATPFFFINYFILYLFLNFK